MSGLQAQLVNLYHLVSGAVSVEQANVTITTRAAVECLPAASTGPAEEERGGHRGEPDQGEGKQVQAGCPQTKR